MSLCTVSYLISLTILFLQDVAKTKSKTRYLSKIAQEEYLVYKGADNVNMRDFENLITGMKKISVLRDMTTYRLVYKCQRIGEACCPLHLVGVLLYAGNK